MGLNLSDKAGLKSSRPKKQPDHWTFCFGPKLVGLVSSHALPSSPQAEAPHHRDEQGRRRRWLRPGPECRGGGAEAEVASAEGRRRRNHPRRQLLVPHQHRPRTSSSNPPANPAPRNSSDYPSS
jgi:hypothetical protein